jgi:hypothetical protein
MGPWGGYGGGPIGVFLGIIVLAVIIASSAGRSWQALICLLPVGVRPALMRSKSDTLAVKSSAKNI